MVLPIKSANPFYSTTNGYRISACEFEVNHFQYHEDQDQENLLFYCPPQGTFLRNIKNFSNDNRMFGVDKNWGMPLQRFLNSSLGRNFAKMFIFTIHDRQQCVCSSEEIANHFSKFCTRVKYLKITTKSVYQQSPGNYLRVGLKE